MTADATTLAGRVEAYADASWDATLVVDWRIVGAATGRSADDARTHAERQAAQQRILEPEDVAPLAVFLASPAVAGITGQVLSADGGYPIGV